MAPGWLFPPFFFEYARPERRLLERPQKIALPPGSYLVFSLIQVLPVILP